MIHLTIASEWSPSGRDVYRWDLFHGPDGHFYDTGTAPTLVQAVTAAISARDLTGDPNPTPEIGADAPSDAKVPHIHAPDGQTLPSQQDIPGDDCEGGSSYSQASKSG